MNSREVASFCGQLRLLLSSGLPLLEAMTLMRGLPLFKRYKVLVGSVIESINEGNPLSLATNAILPPIVTSTMQSAEQAGNLEAALDQLAKFYLSRAEVEEKVKSALVYPCFVLGLAVFILVIMFVFILPGFNDLFADLGTELPIATLIVLNIGKYWYLPVLGLLPVGFIMRNKVDRLPVISSFCRQAIVIQWLASMGALLKGGTPILAALDTLAGSIKDVKFNEVVGEVRGKIENGEKLSRAVEESGYFPAEVVQMLKVGESSGQLSDMLLSVADFKTREREENLKKLTSLIEPALTLSVGLIVGFIVIAMFLPMVNMISNIQ
ncbi:MAG: type II secretion system F family protein [Candidatus Margulisbacteria bacterium]|nr:type II secretion system F family protein [Candidatus Margulisiibacteriota bacterium]